MADLQRINGIGPFYSALIVIRASGFADVLPREEQKALALVGELYGLGGAGDERAARRDRGSVAAVSHLGVVLIRAARRG